MSDLFLNGPVRFNGMEVITSPHLTEWQQHSRSPSRAKRRKAMGHRQHFIQVPSSNAYIVDGKMVVHPARYEAIMQEIAAEARVRFRP